MKKNIYLSIITLITIICIIAGTCYHLLGFGVRIFSNIIPDSPNDKYSDSQTFSSSEIKTINIDASVSDITIKSGNEFKVSYSCNQKHLIPNINLNNDTINIIQKSDGNWLKSLFRNNQNSDITITVPKDTYLEMIKADLSVGDLYMEDIKTKTSSFDFSVGDIDIKNCDIGESDLSFSTGDIDLSDSSFGNLTIDASVGDVDISSSDDLSEYNFDIDTGVGEVSINDNTYNDTYNSKGTNGKTITIDGSTGDIDINY